VFGESAYEVLIGWGGKAFREASHWDRLKNSASGIGLSTAELQERVGEIAKILITQVGEAPFLLYVQVTGGAAPRDHLLRIAPEVNCIATIRPYDWPGFTRSRAAGITLVTVPETRWAFARYKTTQLLGSVLAKKQAHERGAQEALIIDAEGYLLEGASTNLFIVKGGKIWTPPLTRNILPGITRAVLKELLSKDFCECDLEAPDLMDADEVFVASTTKPVLPVTHLDGRQVGDGTMGPVTHRCAMIMDACMHDELGRYPA
jgi:D-alanine transaminase